MTHAQRRRPARRDRKRGSVRRSQRIRHCHTVVQKLLRETQALQAGPGPVSGQPTVHFAPLRATKPQLQCTSPRPSNWDRLSLTGQLGELGPTARQRRGSHSSAGAGPPLVPRPLNRYFACSVTRGGAKCCWGPAPVAARVPRHPTCPRGLPSTCPHGPNRLPSPRVGRVARGR